MRTGLRLAACLSVAWAAASGGGVPTADAAPGKGVVALVPVKGAPVEGEFVSIGPEGVRLAGASAPHALDALREARFAPDGPLAPLPAGSVGLRVVLKGGEMVRGAFVSGSGEGLVVKPPDLPALTVPFDVVRRLEAEPARPGACDDPARERPPRSGADVAYARSGDVLAGTVLSAGPDGLAVETAKGRTSRVPWADLVVAHLDNPALAAPSGVVAEVETVGGSRLVAASVAGDAKSWNLTTRAGPKTEVPVASVRAVRWSGGSFVYATELPFTWKFTPFYADPATEPFHPLLFPTTVDRTAEGCPLRVAGTTFRRGFACFAKTAITVPLGKAFSRFECRFGVDDSGVSETGARGDVTARVLADGKEVWASGGSVRGGDAAKVVGPLDVSGVSTLVLEVDFGADLMVLDRADWADPVLLRAN